MMKKYIKKFKAAKGVSLLELVVSMTIFSVLVLSSTEIFRLVLDGQRGAVSAQNVQENIRYAMEKISKEIRAAQASDTECLPSAVYKIFNTASSDSELYFKNKDGLCVNYYLENNRLKVTVGSGPGAIADFITPAKVEASNLKFYVVDNLISASYGVQAYVTMAIDIKATGPEINKQRMKIQMTISSRYYE